MAEEDERADVAPLESRTVADVDTLRAMADPTRFAILTTLMESSRKELPVMSVKELAARLGEPQTKLYRHVKQLEAAGLIRVAATRIVSGILEQRYQASQRDLVFAGDFLREHADDAETAMSAVLDGFRGGFFRAFRDRSLAPDALPESERYRKPTIFAASTRMNPATATQLSDKLREITTWLGEKGIEDPDGILIEVLIGYYTPAQASGEPIQKADWPDPEGG